MDEARADIDLREENELLKQRLEASITELQDFLYIVSHDFRGPLRAIMSASMILIEDYSDQLNSGARAELTRQSEAARKLNRLLDELLKLSRLNRAQLNLKKTDLGSLLTALAERMGLEPSCITLVGDLSVSVDRDLMESVLANLVDNSIKFCQPGISPQIEMGRDDQGFYFSDHGIGLDPTRAERIFLPFERLNGDDYPGFWHGPRNCQANRQSPSGLGFGFWYARAGGNDPVHPSAVSRNMLLTFIAPLILQTQILHVSAAASLRESFSSISRLFEKSHPRVRVELNFAGSQELAAQIIQGAPSDLFASADRRNLQKVELSGPPRVFAHNQLVIVTPNPGSRISFRSLSKVHRLILAAPQVPAGAYASQALLKATKDYGNAWAEEIKSAIVSQEPDVRSVLAKIVLKEADAGIVYATDARSAGGKVLTFPIEPKYQPNIEYLVGIPRTSEAPGPANEFLSLILGHRGQSILRTAGFLGASKR